jgi:hypothetical protein
MPTTAEPLNFTKAALEALPPAKSGDRDYYNDARVKGLQVVVTETGNKSFYSFSRSAVQLLVFGGSTGVYPGTPLTPQLKARAGLQ